MIDPMKLPHQPVVQDGWGMPEVLIKLGGAAITHKDQLETLNEKVLQACMRHLAELYCMLGPRIVVVHGAGSFGHQQAAASGVAHGGIAASARVRHGFAATRVAVTKLNARVVAALVDAGLPAVGISPCGVWSCSNRRLVTDGANAVAEMLAAGLVPVLHGDAVRDHTLGCTILSGDLIVARLAERLRFPRVVFLVGVCPDQKKEGERNWLTAHRSAAQAELQMCLPKPLRRPTWMASMTGRRRSLGLS